MGLSKSTIALVALSFASLVHCTTHIYDWEFTWISAAPDGLVRPVISVNGQFPPPTINIVKGDRVIIHAFNNLGNTSATLHFHGIYQNGSTSQDGPFQVSQCAISVGKNLTYDFVIDQPGTYFYHSHFKGQYSDGLRGPLIVQDPDSPYKGQYDSEIILTMSDWYHEQISILTNYYLNQTLNPESPEPIPYSALLNDSQNITLKVEPNKTYFLRVINYACFSQMYLHFQNHTMTIIEADGIYTEPREVDGIYLAVAQRYGVLLKTKPTAEKNYAALGKLDEAMFDGWGEPEYPTAEINPNVNAWLVYDEKKQLPPLNLTLDEMNALVVDDFDLIPYDKMPLLANPTQQFTLNLSFFPEDGQNRAGFNNITWLPQLVPSLFTALTTGEAAMDARTYGVNANAMVLGLGEVVELVINNHDTGGHPVHIHGHAPQLVARAQGNFSGVLIPGKGYTLPSSISLPLTPIRRDTWMIAAEGYTVVRFVADNPGVWFFHCHMDWHNIAGLAATFVEAPLELQRTQSVPEWWKENCRIQGFPIEGNAAGNTVDYEDLRGAVTSPLPLGTYVGAPPI